MIQLGCRMGCGRVEEGGERIHCRKDEAIGHDKAMIDLGSLEEAIQYTEGYPEDPSR